MRPLSTLLTLAWSGNIWAQDSVAGTPATKEAKGGDTTVETSVPAVKPVVSVEVLAPESTETEDASKPEIVSKNSVIRVTADGRILIQDQAVAKRKIGDTINARLMEAPQASWVMELEPGADEKLTATAVGALFAVGIRDFETQDVEVPQPLQVGPTPSGPVVIGGPVALMGVATPTGELRMGLYVDRLDTLTGEDEPDLGVAFSVARAEIGLDLDLGDAVSGRVTTNAHSASEVNAIVIDVSKPTEPNVLTTYDHLGSSNGYVTGVREAYLDLRPLEDERVRLQVGLQQSIFGSVGLMDDPNAYYTMGPNHESLPLLAGLVDQFDAGASIHSEFSDGAGTASVQVVNSAEDSALGEQDVNKALIGRLAWQINEPTSISISGLQEKPGDEEEASTGAASVLLDCSTDSLGVSAEFLWGNWDADPSTAENEKFVGGQLSARGEIDVETEAVDALGLVARGAYFDPRSETDDADAWMLVNLSVQGLWDSPDDTRVSTGLGYEVLMPMHYDIAIEHRALLQALAEF